MSNFCSEQGRIRRRLKKALAGQARVCGPRKAGQEGVRLCTPQPETRGERRAGQKGPFMDGHQLKFQKK
jgi:hypothetical protein